MAARARKRREDPTVAERGDEDALDPVEAADVDTVEDDEMAEAGLSELDVDEDDEFDADEEADDDENDAEVPLEEGADPEEDPDAVVPAVPAEAAFDDEDEAVVAAVTLDDDDDDDEIEGLRDGEFVCRSCYMAKRESQLADADRLLCRDCA